jgi:hypothetical protein
MRGRKLALQVVAAPFLVCRRKAQRFCGHCQSKFVYFAYMSDPVLVVIDFPAFFRVDLSGSMAAPSI